MRHLKRWREKGEYMNLDKLFKMQRELDERIIKEHGLEGQDLLPGTILALQVELGELANEWQGFKHWKVNPQPKPKMLEEYVDCLHFVLSLGLQLKFEKYLKRIELNVYDDVTDKLILIITKVGTLRTFKMSANYVQIVEMFIGLGEMLGFTWEQIEQAYIEKNEVNHERQSDGY